MQQKTLIKLSVAVVVLLLGAYLGGAVFVANRELNRHRVWRQKMLTIKALADKEVPLMRAATGLGPLVDACAGKLTPKGFKAIVGFIDPGDLSQGQQPANQLTGYVVDGDRINYDFMQHAAEEPEFRWKFDEALDPWTWDNGEWHTDPSVASYLVLTVPLHVVFPRLSADDKSFSEGTAELRTRVLSLPDGAVLCEGTSEPSTPEKLQLEGRGRTQESAKARAALNAMSSLEAHFGNSLLYTPLAEVCAAADERYCEWIKGQLR